MKTLVWDVDDVLNDLTRAWFEQSWQSAHPDCSLRYDDCVENPPHHLLGVSSEEYLTSLDAFRLSEKGKNLPPVPEVLRWFRQHGSCFRHLALTATPLVSAAVSAAWVMRHFGEWIRSFHFIPSPREGQPLPLYDPTKADFLREFGQADLLVEDNLTHLEAARSLGIPTVVIPRPWNKGSESVVTSLSHINQLLQNTPKV